MTFRIITGDCIEQMAEMPECSVDAIVTDPPYGLHFMGKTWDRFGGPSGKRNTNTNRERGGAMHAGEYDLRLSGQQGFQREAYSWGVAMLRVMKPGAHLLSFGGTRTYHRLTCALEDAGFEIRDCLAWLYGSGFPKSLDVSKAIDKARRDEPDWVRIGAWLKAQREAAGFSRQSLAPLLSGHKNLDSAAANVSNWENGLSFPTWDRWEELRSLLGFGDEMDAEVWRLNGRKGTPGEAWSQREVVGTIRYDQPGGNAFSDGGFVGSYVRGDKRTRDIRGGAVLDEAQTWQGWGTALKPAYEPIVLARKPLSERNVASNVQRWGTGALNIDGCRIGTDEDDPLRTAVYRGSNPGEAGKTMGGGWANQGKDVPMWNDQGRWPANVILDEEAAGMLDEQTGELHSQDPATRRGSVADGMFGHRTPAVNYAGAGGASRFFYVPKADREERNRGVEHFASVDGRTLDGGAIVSEGRTASKLGGPRANHHPTVKPVELMQWLCRMVTPPHGTVLDPFLGSGSTGIAALREGFEFIGIEREPDYVEIARARIVGDAPLFNEETA